MRRSRQDVLAEAARMYYVENLAQDQIAKALACSRSNVSRLLKEARARGIVDIRIRAPMPEDRNLRGWLLKEFGLRDARILDASNALISEEGVFFRVCNLGARVLEEAIQDGDVIATSWGRTVSRVVDGLSPRWLPAAQVVQVAGSIDAPQPEIDGVDVARRLAKKLGARYQYVRAPLLADNPAMCRILLKASSVAAVLKQAEAARVSLVGIGSVDERLLSAERAGRFAKRDLEWLGGMGAVGDVCGRHFDLDGQIIDSDFSKRVVGLGVDSLRRIPVRIGVVTGAVKAKAVLGAVRSGLVNTLVSDAYLVREIMRLCESRASGSDVR